MRNSYGLPVITRDFAFNADTETETVNLLTAVEDTAFLAIVRLSSPNQSLHTSVEWIIDGDGYASPGKNSRAGVGVHTHDMPIHSGYNDLTCSEPYVDAQIGPAFPYLNPDSYNAATNIITSGQPSIFQNTNPFRMRIGDRVKICAPTGTFVARYQNPINVLMQGTVTGISGSSPTLINVIPDGTPASCSGWIMYQRPYRQPVEQFVSMIMLRPEDVLKLEIKTHPPDMITSLNVQLFRVF